MKPKISILLPTRGRADRLRSAIFSLFDTASTLTHLELVVRMDDDDQATHDSPVWTEIAWKAGKLANLKIHGGPRLGYARMHDYYNELAEHADGRLLFIWNDDTEMLTEGWDDKLLRLADEHGPVVQFMRVQAKAHADTTFPVVDRRIFEAVGHLAQHCYVDTWLDKVSAMAGVQVLRNDIVFRHDRLNDQTASDNRSAIAAEHNRWFALDELRRADADKVRALLDGQAAAKENTP